MIVDSHQHVILPTKNQLTQMDEAGIDRTILFATTVHPEMTNDVEAFKKEMRILNKIISGKRNALDARIKSVNEQVRVIEENPGKFIGFGTVPIGLSQEETSMWIKERVVAYNFIGLGEITLIPGQASKLKSIFAATSEFGNLPLWIHTFAPLTLDDIKAIVDLAKQFINVPVILGHLGGINYLETIEIAKENKNLYLDLSAMFSIIPVSLAIKELPERTLFSSDAPYGDPFLVRKSIERVTNDNHVREQILGGNIAQLLSI
ncbi:putative TIM-barrel fold metal-dependent hydrolase [Desulfosporosinus orientis DSM 765]|uniref:Putative TIM-barrel fold metal-dependent hydrolase n=1 Tax=Desulfosporosinus orientis (strain ATCC 19365 / DSM 765 / NCIMB 8382 / VKM B-1628 / Singapore I) TaxID=768706 RepID=G7WA66_DESOD|nr:amidohydrolase family protein [Desulfosporosinus orientis]AET66204.1 putative TIM-barrel fold metal-dependent hydrolase [Desulfosporosinus orientis DSM 765]